MQETYKKGDGFTAVRQYILNRVRGRTYRSDPYVRITGQEIAGVVGMTPQSINEHIRRLIRQGEILRRRRCYFGDPSEIYSERLQRWMSDRMKRQDWFREPVLLIDRRDLAASVGLDGPALSALVKEWLRRNDPDGMVYWADTDAETVATPPESAVQSVRPQGTYEIVRDTVLEQIRNRSCKADLLVRLNGEEIAARLGLGPSAVRRALRNLVRRGVLWREGDTPYYAAVAEVQREQLRAWIRDQMKRGVFADDPLLWIDPTHAAAALRISESDVRERFSELTAIDTAFRVCQWCLFDDTDEDR